MDFIDIVYYINLEYRTDRNEQMLEWFDESGLPEEKIQRISAVHTPGRGHLGCLLSHIKTLELFLSSKHKICIIFEDDYQPINLSNFWINIQNLFDCKKKFDLVMLAYNILESDPTEIDFLRHVNKSFTSSGYIITREFAHNLLQNFKEAVSKLEEQEYRTKQKANEFCLDVYWQKLMPISRWYCFYPRLGKQREGFSDIEQTYTSHSG
jgi:GR25 family glycosyltransferase involved in LPS biosynthesis